MKPKNLKLDDLRLDGETQPRIEIDHELVGDYAEAYRAGSDMPPLDVFFDGANYWLADGFHRWFGARDAGLDKVPCIVHTGTLADARWFSYAANRTHGLRRSNSDKRKAVLAALKHPAGAKMSDGQLAAHVGVSEKMVAKYRSELVSASEIPEVTERVGKDGKTYSTANIGRRPDPREEEEDDPPAWEPEEEETEAEAPPDPEPRPAGRCTTDGLEDAIVDWWAVHLEAQPCVVASTLESIVARIRSGEISP